MSVPGVPRGVPWTFLVLSAVVVLVFAAGMAVAGWAVVETVVRMTTP